MVFWGRFWVILQTVKCLHEHRLSHVSPVLWCSQYWPRIVNTTALFEKSLKLVFQVRKKVQNGAKCPLQLIFTSHTIYTSLFAHKTEFTFVFWCTTRAHGYSASWGVMLIDWCSHVIQVHVTWVPKEFRKSTEGLWNQLLQITFLKCVLCWGHSSLYWDMSCSWKYK